MALNINKNTTQSQTAYNYKVTKFSMVMPNYTENDENL